MFRFRRSTSRQRKSRNSMQDVNKSTLSSPAYDLSPITNQFILGDNHPDEDNIFHKDEFQRKSDPKTPLLSQEKTKFCNGDKMMNKWEKVNVQKGSNVKLLSKQETEEKPMSLREFIEESSHIFEKYFDTDCTLTAATGGDLSEGSTIETTHDDFSVTDISRTISIPNDTFVRKKVTFNDIVFYQQQHKRRRI